MIQGGVPSIHAQLSLVYATDIFLILFILVKSCKKWCLSIAVNVFINRVTCDFQEYCLDLFEPSGHGRRRKRHINTNSTAILSSAADALNATNFAKFKENIEYTVIMPDDIYHGSPVTAENNCGTFLALSGVLGCLLFVAALILCYLTSRLQAAIGSKFRSQQDSFSVGGSRLHPNGQSKFPISFSNSSTYSGRLH